MKKKDLANPLLEVTFRCQRCLGGPHLDRRGHDFKCSPARVEDAPDREHHPWRYFAACDICGVECEQAEWEVSLTKAMTRATGPRTPEGLAETAKNLEGHPTPEEAKRTRFNALKHGLSAETATYFPARPDGYPFCAECTVDRKFCSGQPACVKKVELFMLHHAAFEQRNPKHLMPIYASLHAAVLAVVQQILQTIIRDGTTIIAPEWYTAENGLMCIAQYTDKDGKEHVIKNIQAHPLFKPLGELISRCGLSLSDLGQSQRVIDEGEEEMGRLKQGEENKAVIGEYLRHQQDSMTALRGLLETAIANRERDPVLIEHRQQGDE